MIKLSVADKLKIYTKYIGQKAVLTGHKVNTETGLLTGVKAGFIELHINHHSIWIPLYDDQEPYTITLVLKPLSMLTDTIKQTANNLPIQNFITQYYIQLGFDMPVFFSPGHPENCKYVEELGLATYMDKYSQENLIAV